MVPFSNIEWLGHASFRIAFDDKVIYIDPWEIKNLKPADVIFITHSHFDHFSPQDIEKITKKGTCVVGPEDIGDKIPSDCEYIC
ncbi:MAG: MBL fold metallo-hydrolase, partial [Thermoprotei archaeon]